MNSNLQSYEVLKGTELHHEDGDIEFICPADGMDLCFYKKGSDYSEKVVLDKMKYIVLEAEVLEEYSMCFQINFYRTAPQEGKEADFRMIFGLLPNISLIVPIDLEILNSQQIFPPRTMGRLKMTVFGKPIHLEEIQEIHLTTMPYPKDHRVRIHMLALTKTAPEIIMKDTKLMDELGQWIPKEWPTKMESRAASTLFLRNLLQKAEAFDYKYPYEDWDQYGGWTQKPLTKTGWFHTEFDGTRWWLADPEGNAFISTGIDCLIPGNDTRIDIVRPWCSFIPDQSSQYKSAYESGRKFGMDTELFNYGAANMITAFGADSWWDNWAKILKMYLFQWGINTLGNWSDLAFIRSAKMPYVLPLDVHSPNNYPSTEVKIFRDFPDVYSEEYQKASEEYAKTLEQFKEDPYLIGYFMRNEPAWAFVYELNIAEEMLANPAKTASREAFISKLQKVYSTIGSFNTAWNLSLGSFEDLQIPIYHACSLSEQAKLDLSEFSKEMITQYVKIPAVACRKVDHNHLNLGMRYAYITDPGLLSGYENFDVFSINSYQFSPFGEVENLGKLLNMPVMIGEFHQGALDMGLTAHGIKGVADQVERGKAYRYYVEQASLSKYFLGAHYFQLNDQSCLGRFDGE
ncbi:MAG: beta-galactosidase, partial [Mobilitalea sp.]